MKPGPTKIQERFRRKINRKLLDINRLILRAADKAGLTATVESVPADSEEKNIPTALVRVAVKPIDLNV